MLSSLNERSKRFCIVPRNLIFLYSEFVENKAPAQELMMLVHGHIHPSLQLAYSLKLRQ